MINVCYLIVEIKEDKPMFSFCSFLLLTKIITTVAVRYYRRNTHVKVFA